MQLLVKGLLTLGFVIRQELTGNHLADVHTMDFSKVAHLYDDKDPYQLETYRARANQIAPMFSQLHRDALVDGLLPYLQQINASLPMIEQAKRLRNIESVAIVTGQQAGLFTGPMYSISKALSAIGLAKTLEEDLGRPVVPVFWIASEDHDWAEVNHAYVLNQTDEVIRVTIDEHAESHQMVCHTKLSEEAVDKCIKQIFDYLPEGPFKLDMIRELKGAWKQGDSLSLWFARLMALLFADHGLVIVDPCLPALRHLVVPVWKQAIFRHVEVQKQLENGYKEVIEAGFRPEVVRDESNTTLFYVENCKRYVLEQVTSETLQARTTGIVKPLSNWSHIADLNASKFSSNVLLRPLVQDFLLPTLGYVGGPSEVAYHALSRSVFHAHGRTLPPLILRQRLTLYPASVARILESQRLSIEDILLNRNLVETFLQSKGSEEIRQGVATLLNQQKENWQEFARMHQELGPQVHDMVVTYLNKLDKDTERLKTKMIRLLEQSEQDEVRKLRHVERWLWTDGHQQERRLSPLNVWSKYGRGFINHLPAHSDYRSPAPVYHVTL